MSKVKNNFLTAGVCVAIAFICLFGYLYLQNMSAEIFIKLGWETRTSSTDQAAHMFAKGFWLAFLLYAVLPPLIEELVFRLAVCKTLQWAQLKPWLIISISAILFAVYHRSWSQLVYQLIMGIFLAWIFVKTNNLGWTILIHFINNAFIVTYTYFVRASNDVFALNAGNIILAISSAVLATVIVALLIKKGITYATK